MAYRLSVALLPAALVLTLLRVGDAPAAPFKVMPLGNSITECHDKPGVQPASYRCRLWHMVDSAGYALDFVGSRWGVMDEYTPWPQPSSQTAATCPDAGFDQDHEGHVAWRADELLRGSTNTTYGYPDSLARWVDAAAPDIVLVHIGTNDCWHSQSPSGTADDIREIIDTLQAGNPHVIIILGQILPMADGDKNACVDDLNALLPSVAAEKTTALSSIIVVDHNSGFDINSDSDDGVHPNESGEWKMAAVWYDALVPILSIPVADAGADQSVSRDDDVTLDGNASFDPNGDALRYRWRQVEGLRVTLSDSTVAHPSFSTSAIQNPDSLVFELAVSDSFTTTRDTVAVIVTGRQPAVRVLSPLDSASMICSQPTTLSANAHDSDGTIVRVAFYSGDALIGEATARGDSVWDMAWSSVPCGEHILTARATDDDGYRDTSDAVLLYAGNPPELTPLADTSVAEGDSLSLAINASDADSDPVALAMMASLPGATFLDHGDGTGSFGWRPEYEHAGQYTVRFTASDSLFADTITVTITVPDVNRPPAIACTTAVTIDEAEVLAIAVTGADPDGDSLSLSCDNPPTGAVFTDSGGGRGALDWIPDYNQAG
ncbi:MAG: hypothetical protein GF331_12415, partial [Chitinivibrionales bacterium]|nr:hypothetical protein [Chitinivibrionales bacterium]